MRLVTYRTDDGEWQAGSLIAGDRIAPLSRLAPARLAQGSRSAASTVRGVIGLDRDDLDGVSSLDPRDAQVGGVPRSSARIGPPVTDPQKILCIGLNYRDHAAEAGMDLPTTPIVFAKFANSLIGPADEIVLPADSSQVDYEGELAVVIGRTARHVAADEALKHVAGVMAFNDVSARDLQMATSQWTMGKAIDTFAPCGPALVTLDEIEDIQDLSVTTRVNGETVQSGTTADMVFSVAEIIARLSRVMTLVPGDIIATGTPAGVGMGRTPPLYMRAGDVVEVEIGGIGALRNPVVAATS